MKAGKAPGAWRDFFPENRSAGGGRGGLAGFRHCTCCPGCRVPANRGWLVCGSPF